MQYLSEFNFQIMYQSAAANHKADILSCCKQDIKLQDQIKQDSCSSVFLGSKRLDPCINQKLGQAAVDFIAVYSADPSVTPVLPPLLNSVELITLLKADNQDSFQDIWKKLTPEYEIREGLLLYDKQLEVNQNTLLCTCLIKEAYMQPSTAYSRGVKTYQLLASDYH